MAAVSGRGRGARDVALVLAGVVSAAVLVLGVAGGDGPPPLVAGLLACAAVALAAAGLFDRLPGRASPVVGWAGIAAGAGFYVLLTVACLVTPDDMVTSGHRGPRTPGQARGVGAVLLGVGLVGGAWLAVGRWRDHSRRNHSRRNRHTAR